ncbi:uncharacterized protein FMAN_09364 [Fusarium mangiferae]|uniref:2EXR domain-containing protein n=1 Tax=Fusarium mangiferae TaxID=192010 RepID=A0A1L7SZW9_FUSMA|nr:uncharacterized protein FMAN_09364 [Fusarium mangiferae]CVK91219.1 uncharacterized protein FMAN_09364 [Fusarium mangiferae]
MPLKSFHRMMDLPLEIRHEIYFWATPDRVVHVRYPSSGDIRKGRVFCSTPIPSLLHTCSESRACLSRTGYKLAFQVQSTGSQFWFNFKRDTLFIDRGALILMYQGINPFPFEDAQRIRKIAYERWFINVYHLGIREGKTLYTPRYFPDPILQRHSYDTRNLYKFAEIQKIDGYLGRLVVQADHPSPHALSLGYWCALWSLDPPASIPRDTDLAEYLSEPYEKWRSLDQGREYLELELGQFWAELGRPSGKLPKFKPVHLLTDAEHQFIRRERSIGSEMLQTTFRINKLSGSNKDNQVALTWGF